MAEHGYPMATAVKAAPSPNEWVVSFTLANANFAGSHSQN